MISVPIARDLKNEVMQELDMVVLGNPIGWKGSNLGSKLQEINPIGLSK